MKRSKPLRARALDLDGLKKVHGGRGICRGYYECLDCNAMTDDIWASCPGCGAPYNPSTGGYGGGNGLYTEMNYSCW